MRREFLSKIAQVLSSATLHQEGQRPLLPNHLEGLALQKESFHPLPARKHALVSFVDGGNLPLLTSAQFQVQVLRFYCATWNNKKKVSSQTSEFYLLITSKEISGSIVYHIELFGEHVPVLHKAVFDSFDEHLRTGSNRIDIGSMGNVIRRLCELALLNEQAKKERFIVYDGSLMHSSPYELPYLNSLFDTLKATQGRVVAISKTSHLLTHMGNSVVGVLSNLAPQCAWWYGPLVQESSPLAMCFAKLHVKSRHMFRIEAFPRGDWNDIIALLVSQCNDSSFFGYPYGLVDADRFARVSFDEANYQKTMLVTHMRKKIKRLDWYVAGLNAHEKLDRMSYGI